MRHSSEQTKLLEHINRNYKYLYIIVYMIIFAFPNFL